MVAWSEAILGYVIFGQVLGNDVCDKVLADREMITSRRS